MMFRRDISYNVSERIIVDKYSVTDLGKEVSGWCLRSDSNCSDPLLYFEETVLMHWFSQSPAAGKPTLPSMRTTLSLVSESRRLLAP